MGGLLGLARGIDRLNATIGKSVSWLILLAVLDLHAKISQRHITRRQQHARVDLFALPKLGESRLPVSICRRLLIHLPKIGER